LEDPNWPDLKQEIRDEFPSVRQITVEELKDWLSSSREQPVLIDARSSEEYQVSHLKGALDWDRPDLSENHFAFREKPIVIYCSVGYRSSSLAARLQNKGFEKVYNLEGSIFEWVNSGNPVYRGELEVRVVHPYDSDWGRFLKKMYWSEDF